MAHHSNTPISTRARLGTVAIIGAMIAIGLVLIGHGKYAPLAAWDVAALVYVGWVLSEVLRFDARTTKSHALRENPGSGIADVILLITSIASLAAVGILVLMGSRAHGTDKAIDIVLGLISVVVSWGVVHTLFMLKYAKLYYGDPEGGIDFNNSGKPRYADFAYVAFTIGMTFQVSDTQIENSTIRATLLRQALLAYVFGTVIIATTINVVVTLSSSN